MEGALASGLGFGFLVAAAVGPVWLLCARSTLRGGWRVGAAIGLGAAAIDTLYASLGVAGAASLLRVPGLRVGLGILGGAVLVWIGARSLWSAFRIRLGGEADEEVSSPGRALRTAVLATASNPLTIASWGAIFAGASAAGIARGPSTAMALLAGVGLGSLAWFLVLSTVTAMVRRRVGDRAVWAADAIAGIGLIGFGGALGWRAAHGQ